MAKAEEQYDAIAESLAGEGAVKSQMFGMPCLKIGGKAFAGIKNGEMIFKLTGDVHARAMSIKGAHLFDPMDGRPMKEWVVVPAASAKEWQSLASDALGYVSTAAKAKPKAKTKK